jgi:hypothetical protein
MIDFIACFVDQGCEVVWTSNRDKPEKSRQVHTPLNRKNCLRKPLISGLLRVYLKRDNLSDNLHFVVSSRISCLVFQCLTSNVRFRVSTKIPFNYRALLELGVRVSLESSPAWPRAQKLVTARSTLSRCSLTRQVPMPSHL